MMPGLSPPGTGSATGEDPVASASERYPNTSPFVSVTRRRSGSTPVTGVLSRSSTCCSTYQLSGASGRSSAPLSPRR